MIQVDAFWSYAIGSGFALAAAIQITSRANVPVAAVGEHVTDAAGPGARGPAGAGAGAGAAGRSQLTGTVLYLAMLFAPAAIWLLWVFPSWQTMHVVDQARIPAWAVALVAAADVGLGTLGFAVTAWLLRHGARRAAYLQFLGGNLVAQVVLVHGWDGTGYRRFLTTTAADYASSGGASVLELARRWASSDLAAAFYAISSVMVVVVVAMCVRWHVLGVRSTPHGRGTAGSVLPFLAVYLGSGFVLPTCLAVCVSLLIHAAGWVAGTTLAVASLAAVAAHRPGLAGRAMLRLLPAQPDVAPHGPLRVPDLRRR